MGRINDGLVLLDTENLENYYIQYTCKINLNLHIHSIHALIFIVQPSCHTR
jgi:hypothetical protein